jgi:photosystem II stability/assembly factor-like uncharacterized protein
MKKLIFLLFAIILINVQTSRAQWITIPSNTTNNLTDICFVNDSVGYIVSYAGEVLKTIDTGNTWSLCTTLSGAFTSICNIGSDTIFAAGHKIYRSDNAGTTWQQITNIGFLINNLHFYTSKTGIYQYGYQFCRTHDSGQNWSLVANGRNIQYIDDSAAYIISIGFNESYNGYGYSNVSFYKSYDQGLTWSSTFLGAYSSYNDGYSEKFYFLDRNTGFFLGGSRLYITNDAADTRVYTGSTGISNSIMQCIFLNDSSGYILTSNYSGPNYRSIYKNDASILHWNLDYSCTTCINKIYKLGDSIMFAIGANGTILKRDPFFVISVESFKPNSFQISPNPASSYIKISVPEAATHSKLLSVRNLEGQLLLQKTIKQESTEIDVSLFAKGIYILKLDGENETAVAKFVKE